MVISFSPTEPGNLSGSPGLFENHEKFTSYGKLIFLVILNKELVEKTIFFGRCAPPERQYFLLLHLYK